MKEIVSYSNCFVCGEKNPHGIQARFYFDGHQAVTKIIASEEFAGYRGIYHGGIISTMLDEVMIKALLAQDILAVTAELTVRFKRPVRIGDKIRFTGRLIDRKRRIYYTEGEASDQNGRTLAVATGTYIEANGELKTDLNRSLD